MGISYKINKCFCNVIRLKRRIQWETFWTVDAPGLAPARVRAILSVFVCIFFIYSTYKSIWTYVNYTSCSNNDKGWQYNNNPLTPLIKLLHADLWHFSSGCIEKYFRSHKTLLLIIYSSQTNWSLTRIQVLYVLSYI